MTGDLLVDGENVTQIRDADGVVGSPRVREWNWRGFLMIHRFVSVM